MNPYDPIDNRPEDQPPPFIEDDGPRTQPAYTPPPPYQRPQTPPPYSAPRQTDQDSNIPGLLGFIFALLTFLGAPMPFLGIFSWLAGLVLSCVGLSRRPKGFAIAGLCISLFTLLLVIVLISSFGFLILGLEGIS